MKLDSKGNLMVGSLSILIVSLLLLSIFIITSINYIEHENIEFAANDNFKHMVDDYTQNLEVLERRAIEKATDKVYHSFRLINSENQIKKNLDEILKEKNLEYAEKYDAEISSKTIAVEPTDSPWKVLFKVELTIKKDNNEYNHIIEKNVSIEGLRDPLPPAILTAGSGISYYKDKIYYLHSLSRYLWERNMDAYKYYMFAEAPLTIKKCPYDPYVHHGDPNVLDDCLDKGYFHESADGSCYLCRLEGKGKCPHYGMEVFIQTIIPVNESVSCSDHVVYHDHYNGTRVEGTRLILDDSHRKKYGLI